jgi:hypothetical protein
MIYYVSILLLSLFSFANQLNNKNKYLKIFGVLCFCYLVVLGGLRYQVGTDWNTYHRLFTESSNWKDVYLTKQEILFSIFMYCVKLLINSYSFFIFATFLFAFSVKYYVIQYYSPDIFLSCIIYFFTVFMIYDVNGLRQGIAIGFILLSISSILKEKPFHYLITVTVAVLFHYSAFIFYPFYFLARVQIKNKTLMWSFVVLALFAIPLRSLIENSAIVQNIMLTESLMHYADYFGNVAFDPRPTSSIFNIALLQRLFTLIAFLFYYKQIQIDEKMKLLLRNGYFISIVIFIVFSFSSQISARLSFHYKALEIIMIPLIVSSPIKVNQRLLLLLVFISFSIFGIYRLLSLPDGHLLPYDNLLVK